MRNTISAFIGLFVAMQIITVQTVLYGQPVETGLEMLVKSNFKVLKGNKVGLITNPTGVDKNLRSCIDLIFKAPGVRLTSLYGPEHGVRGEYTAGEIIGSITDPLTHLKVYSLYGNTRKPAKEMLEGIDVLVYDIQDIGSRSYTYISTLGLAMEAAAENNITFIVLDRPNPLGGIRMEGPLVERISSLCKSVSYTIYPWNDCW